jgi:hypothetical protein
MQHDTGRTPARRPQADQHERAAAELRTLGQAESLKQMERMLVAKAHSELAGDRERLEALLRTEKVETKRLRQEVQRLKGISANYR